MSIKLMKTQKFRTHKINLILKINLKYETLIIKSYSNLIYDYLVLFQYLSPQNSIID
jgi:hypothetical protein